MSARKRALTVSPLGPRQVQAAGSLVHEVADLVRIVAECRSEVARQATERTRLASEARVQIARIQAQQALVQHGFDAIFAERAEVLRQLFARLDRAATNDDAAGAQRTLEAITAVVGQSPFAALRHSESAHAALQDRSTVWEF